MDGEHATHIDVVRNKPSTKIVVARYLYVGQLRNFILTALALNLACVLVIVLASVA